MKKPFISNWEEKKHYNKLFSEKVLRKCKEYNISLFSIDTYLTEVEGEDDPDVIY